MESVIGSILAKLRKIDVDYNTTKSSRQRKRKSKFTQKLHNNLQQHAKHISLYLHVSRISRSSPKRKPPQNQPPSANQFHASKTITQNMTSDQRWDKYKSLCNTTNAISFLLCFEEPSAAHERSYRWPQIRKFSQKLAHVHKTDGALTNAFPQQRLPLSPDFIKSAPQALHHILNDGSHFHHAKKALKCPANTL